MLLAILPVATASVALALILPVATASVAPLALGSTAEWTITCANSPMCSKHVPKSLPAKVPGVAHLALLDAGVLTGDPYYRYNELNWSWVAEADWTYHGTFAVDEADAGLVDGGAVIKLEGLDTVAKVSVNGVHVGDANDAFIAWRFSVPSGLLRLGANSVTIAITAATKYAAAQAEAYPYPVPASIYYHTWSEECMGGWSNESGYPAACPGSRRGAGG